MLISPAYAQGAPAAGGDFLVSLLPIVAIFAVFYFLMIRPQQKKMKEHKAMVEALRRGDRVVTNGGFLGTVSKVVSDTELELEIAPGTKVRVIRSSVAEILKGGGAAPERRKGRRKDEEDEDEDEEVDETEAKDEAAKS